MIVAHGVCSSGLFAWANIRYERSHSRRMALNKGLLNMAPQIRLWRFILVVGNFGGPLTVNLVGEVSLIVGSMGASKGVGLMVAGLSFFSAAYSLILYAATQQGFATSSTGPLSLIRGRERLIIFSHV